MRCTRSFVLFLLVLGLALGTPARAEDPPESTGAPAESTPEAGEPPPEGGLPPLEDLPLLELPGVVVTATRTAVPEFDVPRSINVIPHRRIRERGVQSVLDALDDEVGLWVEKRTAHTSDLVVRGLSGGNLLALIDGNTLSTFWGEGGFAGDDMYGKIDPESIERIEVIRGPASVLYGSNALGAVVNFITKSSPFDYTSCGTRWGARSKILAGTAPSMWRFRQEVYGASPSLRWFAGASYWDAGSTRDGGGQRQSPAGGRGWYGDLHLDWRVSPKAELTFTVQNTDNDPVYRYYRPNQDNTNERLGVAAFLTLYDLGWAVADEAQVRLYYQRKRDFRRWFDATTRALVQTGVAKWDTIQAGVQFDKQLGAHALTYGVDFQTTAGESPDDEQFTITPVGGATRKASPDSDWSSLGAFVEDIWEVNRCLSLVGSVRVDGFRIATDVDPLYVPAGGLDPSVDEFTDTETAFVGGLHALLHLSRTNNLYGGWSRGFRQFAPHFGVTEHGFGIIVPSQLLDPVTADQYEVGYRHRSDYVQGDAAVYYTRFRNFQNVVRGSFQGQDWFDFDGDGVRDPSEDVFVTTGNGKAYVYGVELGATVNLALASRRLFGECWTVGGGFMWNYGRDQTNDIPLRHTHPARGFFTLRFDGPDPRQGIFAELSGEFVRHYDRIPPSRLAGDVGYLDDPQDPASGMRRTWGLPGYAVWDFRGGFNVGRNVTVNFAVENIFDERYRPAHARWDAPGVNFWATVEVTL
ncbi:MAG: TonB-dependent receptor [Planctomycetota bacterium]|jgi:outer membrane receptor protein involved in Fe transport